MNKDVYDRRIFEKGRMIIRQGEKSSEAFLIHTGEVEVFDAHDNTEQQIARLGPSNIIGEMALIEDRVHRVSVRALEQTIVYVVSKELLDKKLRKADPLIKMLIDSLISRLGDCSKMNTCLAGMIATQSETSK
jgi:CRP-like cAMP-binding protein